MCLLYALLHLWLCAVDGKASHSRRQNGISWLTELADTVLSRLGETMGDGHRSVCSSEGRRACNLEKPILLIHLIKPLKHTKTILKQKQSSVFPQIIKRPIRHKLNAGTRGSVTESNDLGPPCEELLGRLCTLSRGEETAAWSSVMKFPTRFAHTSFRSIKNSPLLVPFVAL